jgi:hypothetical protein
MPTVSLSFLFNFFLNFFWHSILLYNVHASSRSSTSINTLSKSPTNHGVVALQLQLQLSLQSGDPLAPRPCYHSTPSPAITTHSSRPSPSSVRTHSRSPRSRTGRHSLAHLPAAPARHPAQCLAYKIVARTRTRTCTCTRTRCFELDCFLLPEHQSLASA